MDDLGIPGDVGVDFKSGLLTFDRGDRKRFQPDVFVDAREFGAAPDVGDVTSELRKAIASVPENNTLFIPPGTYEISDTIKFDRDINVFGYGATFDLGTNTPTTTFSPGIPENYNAGYLNITAREAGTLTDKAAVIIGGPTSPQIVHRYVKGLKVIRTASAATAAARLHAGIVILNAFDWTFEDLLVRHFREGIVITTDTNVGCSLNRIVRPHVEETRYPITFYAAASGSCNGNYVYDHRALVSSSLSGDPSWDSRQWELVRVMWATTSGNRPNQIGFYNCTLETSCGRKLRLEASDCMFLNCRWEALTDQSFDITIGEASRANSNWTANFFLGRGAGLQNIFDDNRIEFLATISNINNMNTFYTGERLAVYGNVGTTTGFTAAVMIASNAATSPAISFLDTAAPRVEKVMGYAGLPTAIQTGNFGGFAFYDASTTARNSIAMRNASPWELRTLAGLEIGSDLAIIGQLKVPLDIGGLVDLTLDGTANLFIENPNTSGKVVFKAQSTDRTYDFYNASSSANDVLRVLDSGRDVRMVLKATETGYAAHYCMISMYEESTPGSPALANGIGLATSSLGSGTLPNPVMVQKGLWVNRASGDYDSRFEGLADANLLYCDAGQDRVGIGTNVPDEKLQVAGAIHADTELIVDEGVTMAITEVGTPGTTLNATHYTVLLDATSGNITMNLPAAASHTGRMYRLKRIDKGTNFVHLNPNGSELIEGEDLYQLYAYGQFVVIQSDGTEWWIVG